MIPGFGKQSWKLFDERITYFGVWMILTRRGDGGQRRYRLSRASTGPKYLTKKKELKHKNEIQEQLPYLTLNVSC